MNRYRLMRYERGLGFNEVVNGAPIGRGTLNDLESGEPVNLTAPVAKRLANFYGITVAELMNAGGHDDSKTAAA